MNITKTILNWTESEMEKINNDIMNDTKEVKHPYVKAFCIGAVEGFIDTTVTTGIVLTVVGVASKIITKKK